MTPFAGRHSACVLSCVDIGRVHQVHIFYLLPDWLGNDIHEWLDRCNRQKITPLYLDLAIEHLEPVDLYYILSVVQISVGK